MKVLLQSALYILARKKFVAMLDSVEAHTIGFSGNVSDLDRHTIKELNIPAPSSFALWLFKENIEAEKKRRQAIFRQSCIDVLGEDPNDWR